jgi:hypothetical protein
MPDSNWVVPAPEGTESTYSSSYLHRLCEDVRTHLITHYLSPKGTPKDLDDYEVNPLSGHCYECARELSFALYRLDIPHRVVKGGIKPLLEQHDELEPPYTMDDIEAVGARHYWVEIDDPNTDTTWVLELCSENYDTGYCDIYVETEPHNCLVRLDNHTNREPWENNDPNWWWTTQTLKQAD